MLACNILEGGKYPQIHINMCQKQINNGVNKENERIEVKGLVATDHIWLIWGLQKAFGFLELFDLKIVNKGLWTNKKSTELISWLINQSGMSLF